VVLGLVLVGWLATGCKEAVAPITPKHVHDHGDADDEEDKLPKDVTAEDIKEALIPKPPPPEPLPDFQQAVAEARSSDEGKERSGVRKLGRFLAEGSAAQRQTAKQILRDKALNGKDYDRRNRAAWALGRGMEETYPILLQLLDDEDAKLVSVVIDVLKSRPGYPAVTERIRGLLAHPDERVRNTAGPALIEIYAKTGNFDGLASLLGIYDTDLSAKAAIELTLMGRKIIPDLIRVLKTSPDPDQRHGAALVLAMVAAGTSPKQEKFAKLAMTKVYVAPDPGGEPQPADRRAVKPLVDALRNDESAKVREMAAQGLGYLGDARSAAALGYAVANDPAAPVRRRAAAALILIPSTSAQANLEEALRTDESEHVRRYAAEALGWIGSSSVVPALVDACEDPAAEVRRYAAIQLGNIVEEEEEELPERLRSRLRVALARLFSDDDPDVRWAAVMAMGKLCDEAAAGQLTKALDDPVSMVSHAAERGLQKLGIAMRKAEEFKDSDR